MHPESANSFDTCLQNVKTSRSEGFRIVGGFSVKGLGLWQDP